MKILFYILSLLVIVGAAWFSNSNKDKFVEQQTFRINTIEKNRRVSERIDDTEGQLNVEKTKLTSAKDANAVVKKSIASLELTEKELRRQLGEIEAELELQQEKLDDAAKAKQELVKLFQDMGIPGEVDIDTFQANFKMLEDTSKELTRDIEELENAVGASENRVDRNRAEIVRLDQRKQARDERIANNARESMITAVDSDWGFVVIGAGSSSGFEPKGRLLVMRGGRTIAEVVPSSIEKSQTIAEIDYETISPGVVLQPGDRVMRIKPALD